MRAFQIAALLETAVRDERERGIVRSTALEDAARQVLESIDRALPYAPYLGQFDALADAANELRAALSKPAQPSPSGRPAPPPSACSRA